MLLRIYLLIVLYCLEAVGGEAIADGLGNIGTMKISVQILEDKVRVVESRPDEEKGSLYFADFGLVLISEQGERLALIRTEEKWPDIPEAGSRGYAGTIQFDYPTPKPDLTKIKSVIVYYRKTGCMVPVRKDAIQDSPKVRGVKEVSK